MSGRHTDRRHANRKGNPATEGLRICAGKPTGDSSFLAHSINRERQKQSPGAPFRRYSPFPLVVYLSPHTDHIPNSTSSSLVSIHQPLADTGYHPFASGHKKRSDLVGRPRLNVCFTARKALPSKPLLSRRGLGWLSASVGGVPPIQGQTPKLLQVHGAAQFPVGHKKRSDP